MNQWLWRCLTIAADCRELKNVRNTLGSSELCSRSEIDLWARVELSIDCWAEAHHHDWKSHLNQCAALSVTTLHMPRDGWVLFWYRRLLKWGWQGNIYKVIRAHRKQWSSGLVKRLLDSVAHKSPFLFLLFYICCYSVLLPYSVTPLYCHSPHVGSHIEFVALNSYSQIKWCTKIEVI